MGLDDAVGGVVALFIIAVLGYVFAGVLWQLNPLAAILFVVAIIVMGVGVVRSLFS